MASAELQRSILLRSSVRANVTKAIKKLDPVIPKAGPFISEDAEVLQAQLEGYQDRLKHLDVAILGGVEGEKVTEEIEKSLHYDEELSSAIAKIRIRIRNGLPAPTPSGSSNRFDATPKLPRLEIAKFAGSPLQWEGFWDDFSSSIHNRQDLPKIDKFKYLKSFLDGDALRFVNGYRLTEANYESVIEALKNRYGDTEVAVFAHLESLLALPVASSDVSALRKGFDDCESHIRSLVALDMPESTFGKVFCPIILSKLPRNIKTELHRKNGSEKWTLPTLRTLLREEIEAREKSEMSFCTSKPTPTQSEFPKPSNRAVHVKKSFPTASTLMATARKPDSISPTCAFCNGKHFSGQCERYPDYESRNERVKWSCRSCLRKGHSTKDCNNKKACYFCKRPGHHQSLCRTKFCSSPESTDVLASHSSRSMMSGSAAVQPQSRKGESDAKMTRSETNLSLQVQNSRSVLQTALGKIAGANGHAVARFYFDTGGSRSFVRTSIAKTIGAKVVGKEHISIGRFGDAKRRSSEHTIYQFDVQFPSGEQKTVRMSGESTISCPIQLFPLSLAESPFLSSIPLAEPLVSQHSTVDIDILVGGDYYYEFVGSEQIRCSNGLVLLSSPFGYIAAGNFAAGTDATPMNDHEVSMFLNVPPDDRVSYNLERFWRLEDIGIKDQFSLKDDEIALQQFNETVKYEGGRYLVRWPWKDSYPELTNNFGLAFGRLKSLVRRIRANPLILAKYDQTIAEQLASGIVEKAPAHPEGLEHYVPHHCVVNPSKATTKLRIVYDASAKSSKEQLSLNDCLYRGPVILSDSVGILLRWRLHEIAMVSDVEKAFLQVGLQRRDKDVTRFLWLKDTKQPVVGDNLQILRFCRVPFGVIASPFLLGATISHHLKTTGSAVALSIENNIYVDNVFGGAQSVTAAFNYYQEAKSIFSSASMNLREWHTNSVELRRRFNEHDAGKPTSAAVLGMKWNLDEDTFSIATSATNADAERLTKRTILQIVASVFDPLGLFGPIVIRAKQLLQQLWRDKYSWDDILPESLSEHWRILKDDLRQIATVKVKRKVCSKPHSAETSFELHCFCDASARAYAAVLYLKSVNPHGSSVSLIFSKCRLAPIKHITIPRLELMAVVVGSRILQFAHSQLSLPNCERYLWTDSQCVLPWIKGRGVTTTFVQNRLREINSYNEVTMRFVPSLDNPADLPSRGISLDKLVESRKWWRGPQWLSGEIGSWPSSELTENLSNSEPETEIVLATVPTTEVDPIFGFDRFSTLRKLLRTVCYFLRFVNRLKQTPGRIEETLAASEIEHSMTFVVKRVQAVQFKSIMNSLTTGQRNDLCRHLGLFLDPAGIIRCRGRRMGAPTSMPVLLPRNHSFSDLVIRSIHVKLLHAGVQHTLAQCRENFWILHGRSQVKRVVRNCTYCRRQSGGSFRTPSMPPLPLCRLATDRPFAWVGLDYFGPLYVKEKDEFRKVWVALFTCAAIRAVHLDVICDMSASQFLLCLRRFMALFGRPKVIICDNAKQFHSSAKLLSRLWREALSHPQVQDSAAGEGITWKFIPEMAPWMGGFYERMVGVVKRSLKKAIDRRCLSFIELQTVMAEVCSVVNSRPLLYVGDSPEETVLTPSHFLSRNVNGASFPGVPLEDEFDPDVPPRWDLIKQWKRIQGMLDCFWKVWVKDYVQSIQAEVASFNNRNTSPIEPRVGTVVLVGDHLPRCGWKIGRITELIPSADQVCRSALVQLPQNKVIRRPLRLLHPLEYSMNQRDTEILRQGYVTLPRVRPVREAARIAAHNIRSQLATDLPDSD